MRSRNMPINEYDLQAKTYPTTCTHHRLRNNDKNKIPIFPECITISNKRQNTLVSQMRATLAASCEPAGKLWKLCKVLYVFSCDQAALQMVFSVCLSVCLSVRLSVCHTFFTMFPSSYHHEIFRSYNHGQKWCPCKRSRSQRSTPNLAVSGL